jgi:hypothetical protein
MKKVQLEDDAFEHLCDVANSYEISYETLLEKLIFSKKPSKNKVYTLPSLTYGAGADEDITIGEMQCQHRLKSGKRCSSKSAPNKIRLVFGDKNVISCMCLKHFNSATKTGEYLLHHSSSNKFGGTS